jgi:uncharacterized protein DUF1585
VNQDRKTAEKTLKTAPRALAKLDTKIRAAELRRDKAIELCKATLVKIAQERASLTSALRDRDQDSPVDDQGALPDGTKIAGGNGLRAFLAKRSARIARAVAKKLMIFALGRGPIAADDEALDALVEKCAPDYKLGDMIVELVKLDAFQQRRADGGKQWR